MCGQLRAEFLLLPASRASFLPYLRPVSLDPNRVHPSSFAASRAMTDIALISDPDLISWSHPSSPVGWPQRVAHWSPMKFWGDVGSPAGKITAVVDGGTEFRMCGCRERCADIDQSAADDDRLVDVVVAESRSTWRQRCVDDGVRLQQGVRVERYHVVDAADHFCANAGRYSAFWTQ